MLTQISRLLSQAHTPDTHFPPTILYNEGWMLRLVLDWFHSGIQYDHPLAFYEDSNWYSEALLPSQFKPRSQKDSLGESYTHADGAIGHFTIGGSGKGDLVLNEDASQLIILEAKMFSKLSAGVSHARYFDQAARNVACMAEVLRLKNIHPSQMDSLGFYVLAPQSQFEKESSFGAYTEKSSVIEKVHRRAVEYQDRKEYDEIKDWFDNYFLPLIKVIDIQCISWEDIIEFIASEDEDFGSELKEFYELCLKFNQRDDDKKN